MTDSTKQQTRYPKSTCTKSKTYRAYRSLSELAPSKRNVKSSRLDRQLSNENFRSFLYSDRERVIESVSPTRPIAHFYDQS